MTAIRLPEGCTLAYYVTSEAYYAANLRQFGAMSNKPELMVCAAADSGGCKWEFAVEQDNLGGSVVRIKMFNDSFVAYQQIAPFFEAMADEQPDTLGGVREILDRLGAVDQTQRMAPAPHIPRVEGAVIRCRIKGLTGVRVAERETGVWLVPGVDACYPDDQIEAVVEILSTGGAQ